MSLRGRWLCCVSVFLLTLSISAYSKSEFEEYVQDHFEILYQKYRSLDQQTTLVLDLQRQIEDLRNENRLMRSNLEELQHQLEQQKSLLSILSNNASQNATSTSSSPSTIPSSDTVVVSDQTILLKAKNALRAGQVDLAIKWLEPLTASHIPQISSESQYWLGVSYVSKQQCLKAIPYLQSFYQSNPHTPLASEAMLAYGLCQKQQGDLTGYKTTINALKKRYPQSSAAKSLR